MRAFNSPLPSFALFGSYKPFFPTALATLETHRGLRCPSLQPACKSGVPSDPNWIKSVLGFRRLSGQDCTACNPGSSSSVWRSTCGKSAPCKWREITRMIRFEQIAIFW